MRFNNTKSVFVGLGVAAVGLTATVLWVRSAPARLVRRESRNTSPQNMAATAPVGAKGGSSISTEKTTAGTDDGLGWQEYLDPTSGFRIRYPVTTKPEVV